jgi:hypothetical protein
MTAWLSRVARAGALVLAFVLIAAPRAAHAAPVLHALSVPGHPRLDVTYESGLEDTARELADQADDALAEIATDLPGLPTPGLIHLQVVRDASELAEIAPAGRGAPAYAIGVAYPDLGVISVAVRRGGQQVDPTTTLRHELGHIALGAALGPHVPRWLHEGFANQHAGDFSFDRIETLAGMTWAGGVIPYDELDRSFPAEETPASHAYAESYDFVGFLTRRGRWEDPADDGDRWPFRRFLRGLAHGEDIDRAAHDAYGKPIHGLFEEWNDDVGKRYLWAPVGLLGIGVWFLCAVLLVLGWWRKKRHNRRRIAQWERDEAQDRRVAAPPYVAWPGEDPLGTEPSEPGESGGDADDRDPPPPTGPRWIN